MVCETIDLVQRRTTRQHRLRAPEVPESKGDNIVTLTDYQARRATVVQEQSIASDADEVEDYTLFP